MRAECSRSPTRNVVERSIAARGDRLARKPEGFSVAVPFTRSITSSAGIGLPNT